MTTSSTRSLRIEPSLVERLFARFATAYGAQKLAVAWGSVPKEAVIAEWTRGLAPFDEAVVWAAYERVLASGESWVPTLPEFLAACRRCQPARPRALMLAGPRDPRDIERGAEHMASIRTLLRMPARA